MWVSRFGSLARDELTLRAGYWTNYHKVKLYMDLERKSLSIQKLTYNKYTLIWSSSSNDLMYEKRMSKLSSLWRSRDYE
jgi:hypothetical protein